MDRTLSVLYAYLYIYIDAYTYVIIFVFFALQVRQTKAEVDRTLSEYHLMLSVVLADGIIHPAEKALLRDYASRHDIPYEVCLISLALSLYIYIYMCVYIYIYKYIYISSREGPAARLCLSPRHPL